MVNIHMKLRATPQGIIFLIDYNKFNFCAYVMLDIMNVAHSSKPLRPVCSLFNCSFCALFQSLIFVIHWPQFILFEINFLKRKNYYFLRPHKYVSNCSEKKAML